MDYEHDDRRAADVPGATGAEGSGLPAGREPLDAGLPSSRSPEILAERPSPAQPSELAAPSTSALAMPRAFDPHPGSGPDPSELTASGQADDLFDAMFLTGGLRPPAFAAVDHDLGFPPPQAPDLASAFLAALDAIDDRRFVTPVPDEPPAAPIAPVETAAPVEPAYELRPQSRLELESEGTPEPVDETPAAPVAAEGAERLPWDTGRVPVAGLLTSGEVTVAGEREAEPARAAVQALEGAAEGVNSAEGVEEFATIASVEDAEPIEEAAYFAAGLDGDAGDSDDAEAAAVAAAEADAEAEAVAAAAAQADADAEAAAVAAAEADAEAEAIAAAAAQAGADAEAAAGAAAAEADAVTEAEVLAALALAEAEQAELEAAIAAEAALDEAGNGASDGSYGASAGFAETSDRTTDETADETADEAPEEAFAAAFDAVPAAASVTPAFEASLDASLDAALDGSPDGSLDASLVDDDAFDMTFDAAAFDATPDAESAAPLDAGMMPGDDDFELEPSIGMEPMDAAPMTFDGPDAFAPAPAEVVEPEPEPESDELEDLQDFVVFSLGDMRCVVPIRNVVEVGRIPDAAPVPNAPAWLYGLGNLRGQVLSLIDLRAFFGVGRIKASTGRMVVLRGDSDDITAGVMVDQVHQIVALSPSRFKEAPAELPLPDKSTEFVWGACDYGNYTMIGLDVDGVLGVESLTEETV